MMTMNSSCGAELNFINIVPVNAFTVSEVLRQHQEIGLEKFALLLSLHPVGTPAMARIPSLIDSARKVIDELKKYPAIHIGILLQSTMGHGWSGLVPLTGEPWQRTVRMNGNVTSRMCPIDPGFQDYIFQVVGQVMTLSPKFLMLDDDFGLRGGECFCPRHIAEINHALGKDLSFDEIISMIEKRPQDDLEILKLSKLRGELTVEFARKIREVIDRYDNTTPCVICCNWGEQGFAGKVAEVLAGKNNPPSLRVPNAVYGQNQPLLLLSRNSIVHMTRAQMPEVKEFLCEADTFPQNYYSESAVLFHTHIVNGIQCGLSGAKLWMSKYGMSGDHCSQKRYEDIFSAHRNMYQVFYDTLQSVQWLGVAVPLYRPKEILHPSQCDYAVYHPDWNSLLLGVFGIPIRYENTDEEGIFALTSAASEKLSNEELNRLFRQKLLLDSGAVKKLTQRGYAAEMGVKAIESPDFFFTEECDRNMNSIARFMWEPSMAKLEAVSSRTQAVRWCANRSGANGKLEKISPCMTFFENECGGKVVALAWTPEMPFHKIYRPQRRIDLVEAFDFLNDNHPLLTVEVPHPMLIRHGKLADGSEILTVISLCPDEVPDLPIRDSAMIIRAERLKADGTWQEVKVVPLESGYRLETVIKYCKPEIFRFSR